MQLAQMQMPTEMQMQMHTALHRVAQFAVLLPASASLTQQVGC
jgi:hypothetical protein